MGVFSTSIGPKIGVRSGILPAHKLKLMELLRYSATDLVEHLQEQSYANPLLDVQSRPVCPRCGRALERTGCAACRSAGSTFRRTTGSRQQFRDEEQHDPTELIQQHQSAFISLAEQIGELPLSENEREIADHLLGELDEKGLLVGSVAEHAALLRTEPELVEKVRLQLLHLEPVGIAAIHVRECLAVKVKSHAATASWAPAALKLLETNWESFVEMDFAHAARALRLSQNQVIEVVRGLANLCPYPLQGLRDDERDTLPAMPDVRFEVAGTGTTAYAMIEVLEQERTAIKINNHYLKQYQGETTAALRSHLSDYRREACFLQKAVEQRWKTMERVCLAIFEAQRFYFTQGNYCPTTLVPLTRESIAATLRMHPSTIGRAIEEKYAALPNGRVVPLRYFFDQNVPIRALLRRHITAEDRAMSDGDLCDYLAHRGWSMSRRAAAYHREAANILPKKLRSRERLLHHRSAS
jgi:RNA polymerase sigma-54 factor